MKPVFLQFALLVAVATAFAACDPASEFAHDKTASPGFAADTCSDAAAPTHSAGPIPASASCPCFSGQSLSANEPDYYLFFDVFNYYGLDARRTEARALVSTEVGLLEEVAAVYITHGSPGELYLICHRQEVVEDPVTGEPYYEYETLAPTVAQAESCRRAVYASVGKGEPCQGAACGMEYTKEQTDPDYPPYHDENYRTPETLFDAMERQIEEVGRTLRPLA